MRGSKRGREQSKKRVGFVSSLAQWTLVDGLRQWVPETFCHTSRVFISSEGMCDVVTQFLGAELIVRNKPSHSTFSKIMTTKTEDQLSYLKGLQAVRERSRLVLEAANQGALNNFDYYPERLSNVADKVSSIIEVCLEV